MRVTFTTGAAQDLGLARLHYVEITDALADQFLDDLDRCVERLQMFPGGAPPVDGFPGLRRARMRQFPFRVFYRIDGDELVVLRVLHTRQDAGPALSE